MGRGGRSGEKEEEGSEKVKGKSERGKKVFSSRSPNNPRWRFCSV